MIESFIGGSCWLDSPWTGDFHKLQLAASDLRREPRKGHGLHLFFLKCFKVPKIFGKGYQTKVFGGAFWILPHRCDVDLGHEDAGLLAGTIRGCDQADDCCQ